MFFRWLLIAFIIYLIYRLITGSKRRENKKRPFFTFYANHFPGDFQQKRKEQEKQNLDQIEEAEFEDITEKDN